MQINTIINGDCLKILPQIPENSINLIFADPPFNIDYEYDIYQDNLPEQRYIHWTHDWLKECWRVLHPHGTLWAAIGDEYAAELIVAAKSLGYTKQSWVIWYYTFGTNCTHNFTRSHTHLIRFTKHPTKYTFNKDDLQVRIPSARQLTYNDKRANPKGRLPDNTWIINPVSLIERGEFPELFKPEDDVWLESRVAGTFKERAGFHGCQMPERILERIIRLTSNPDEVILDPFAGSATTLVVANYLQRNWLGIELSPDYTKKGLTRILNNNWNNYAI